MRNLTVCRAGAAAIFLIAASTALALSGFGDSAPGNLDTVAPTPGTASVPATADVTGADITYDGASDSSGIARVELWAREDSAAWMDSSLFGTGTAGSFNYAPAGTGLYHFDLVAEDNVGNRSAEPPGDTGTGQGSTMFPASIGDWIAFK